MCPLLLHIFFRYELGTLFLGVDHRKIAVANESDSENDTNLLYFNLSSSIPTLVIGGGMAGCYLEGAHTRLSASDVAYVGIDWNSCPLPTGKNCCKLDLEIKYFCIFIFTCKYNFTPSFKNLCNASTFE